MGTPKNTLMRCRSRLSSTVCGVNPGSTTWVAPTSVPPQTSIASSAAWYIGATCRIRSPSRSLSVRLVLMPTHRMRWWSNSAPLGRPVVPDVYKIRASSDSAMSTSGRLAGRSAARSESF